MLCLVKNTFTHVISNSSSVLWDSDVCTVTLQEIVFKQGALVDVDVVNGELTVNGHVVGKADELDWNYYFDKAGAYTVLWQKAHEEEEEES